MCPGIGRRKLGEGGLPWQPAVEGMGGEERWQTPNYLAARLLASLVCAPLHMFYAYETRNVINRLAAAANSRCEKNKRETNTKGDFDVPQIHLGG